MRKILLIAGLCLLATPAMAADECRIMAYMLDESQYGIQILGNHLETGVIDAGNSESYTIPKTAHMVRIVTTADVWVNISTAGTAAAVDADEYIPQGVPFDRGSRSSPVGGQIVKCIADS